MSVHLLVTAEVPLGKALYPHAPRGAEWLPTAPVYGICIYECVTLCVCVSAVAYLDGLKAEDKF